MKRRIEKLTALALVGVMGMSMFTGCGSSSSSDEATEEAANDGKTHVEFFNQKTEIVDILEELISEYEAENPDVAIDLVTPADASTVLNNRMASDDTPDIYTNWPNSNFFAQVDAGYVMDLSDTGIMDNIQDAARNQWKYNDGEYAATVSYNCSGIWVNKDIFEANGLSTEIATWDDLMSACETLKAAGVTPFMTPGKETDKTDRQFQVFLASSMGDSYDAFEADASAAAFDTSASYTTALTSMAEKMIQMAEYSQDDITGTDQDSATANFANGEGAMMIGGSWLKASITAANPDMNITMIPIPGDTAEETNTCAYPGDMTLCIANNSDVQDEAVAFVKWFTSPEIATKYAEAEGNPSCINGVDYVADELSDLYSEYVTTGKFILNPDCGWTSAQQDAAGAAIQQLYYDRDASAFVEYIASAFNDN